MAIAENPSLKHSVVGAGLLDHGILAVDYLHQTVYFQRFDQTEVRDEVIEDKVVIIPGKVNDITGAYFKANIHDYSHGTDFTYSGDKPIVIDFWATWCGPCKKMAPLFEQWAEKYKDRIIFLKVNADKENELCNKFKVNALPTFIFLPVGGRPIIEVGARPRSHRTNHHRTIVKISATQKRPKIARHTLHLLRSQRLFQNRQSYPPAFGHLPRGTRKEEGNMKPAFGDSLCYIFERNGNGAPNAPRHLFPPRHLPAFPPRAPSPFRPMLTRR